MVSYDVDEQAVDGAYKMTHQGEKFSIGRGVISGSGSTKQTKEDDPEAIAREAERKEQEELQKALEQIRALEEKEQLQKAFQPGNLEEFLAEGEYVYELYGIMIHSGGAYGGHYFSYIKSFEDGKWYNFNDRTVTEIENEEDLFKTFGGQGASNTAYMLMYRKVKKDRELGKFPDELVPSYLAEEIEAEAQKLITQEKAELEKILTLNLKVYNEEQAKDIRVKKTDKLSDLIKTCYSEFGIEGKEVSDSRLRMYDVSMKVRLDVYDKYDEELIEMDKLYSKSTLDLEFKD